MAKLGTFIKEISEKTTENNQYEVLTSSQNGIVSQEEYFNKQIASVDNVGYKIIKKGQFTYRSMSDTGRFYINRLINKEIGIVSPAYPVFELVGNELDPEYLELFFQSEAFQRQISDKSSGSTRLALRFSKLENVEIEIPSIETQKEIINSVIALKEANDVESKNLFLCDELIKSRFIEMFGDIKENTKGFDQVDFEYFVDDMHIGPFGSDLKNDCFVPKENSFAMVYEQKHAIQKTMNVETRYVDEEKFKKLKHFVVGPGDILVSCRGTLGECYLIPNGAPIGVIHPSLMFIRLKKGVDPKFMLFILERFLSNQEGVGSGVKMAIRASELAKYKTINPSKDLIASYLEFVAQVDKLKFSRLVRNCSVFRQKMGGISA